MNNGRHFGLPACRRDACSSGDHPCPHPAECNACGIEAATIGDAILVALAAIALAAVVPMGPPL
jgi:hypothetical protein